MNKILKRDKKAEGDVNDVGSLKWSHQSAGANPPLVDSLTLLKKHNADHIAFIKRVALYVTEFVKAEKAVASALNKSSKVSFFSGSVSVPRRFRGGKLII